MKRGMSFCKDPSDEEAALLLSCLNHGHIIHLKLHLSLLSSHDINDDELASTPFLPFSPVALTVDKNRKYSIGQTVSFDRRFGSACEESI